MCKWQQDDIIVPCRLATRAQFQMFSYKSFVVYNENLDKIKMATGSHLHFDNDHMCLKRFKCYSIFNFWSSKIQDGGQNGGIFRRRLADRFPLSRAIFIPKGMFVAFVVSLQYILLHTDRQTYVDSITQIRS
jgi:hypothetical protein